MKNSSSFLAVKFKSTHHPEKLLSICEDDLELFRDVPGLVQKYYIIEEGTEALSGVYIFESEGARTAYLDSALAKQVPARYAVIPETLRVELYEVAIVLNEPSLV